MSSSEPIRRIGPLDGGTWVERPASTERVERRRRRPQDDSGGGHAAHQQGQDDDAQDSQRPATPIRDPRAYDDHGRSPGSGDGADRPHIDATA